MTYTIKSNQYIPHKGETSPNGVRLAKTYYYIVNDQGKTISHKTGKPYRGKNLAHYKFDTHKDANDFMGRLYMQSLNCLEVLAAREVLEKYGYFAENLWHVNDVQSQFDCSAETAQEVLLDAMTNIYCMQSIFECIQISATENHNLELLDY